MSLLVWSCVLAGISAIGTWLLGNRNRWGFAVNFGAQFLWFGYAVSTVQYGFIASAVLFGVINARNFRAWSSVPTSPKSADQRFHLP